MIKAAIFIIATIIFTAVCHITMVLTIPRYFADSAWSRLNQLGKYNQLIPATATKNMPSFRDSAFLTSYCLFDIAKTPVSLYIPQSDYYWTVTIYDRLGRAVWNNDNVTYPKPYAANFSYKNPGLLGGWFGFYSKNDDGAPSPAIKDSRDEEQQTPPLVDELNPGGSDNSITYTPSLAEDKSSDLAEPIRFNDEKLPVSQGIIALRMFIPLDAYHKITAAKMASAYCKAS